MTQAVSKILSPNDLGETGGHQAGILVPKKPEILGFFPLLTAEVKNPRHLLTFRDDHGGRWDFPFIYYNGKFFGGTRNEFRLTGMTGYFREAGLVAGDELVLEKSDGGGRRIAFRRARATGLQDGVLRLGGGWKVVSA
ncbi:EcoRII N-terminal effector-binding domain-containing protein [Brevundimonas sp. SPF441]|uniref:EcoRII N-terminal effector-binding domain-containing protein n=1 Tax=Brevundimonas sp. SPF441 TaxID=2663795 RepID=UPI00129D3F78|nr:EcoRII N-terminal effector-binding domain-containing protein [Brevundimonas sp. SPF441]MRL70014.1 hypothetical protein [Brevundimonas sp. SPF441]